VVSWCGTGGEGEGAVLIAHSDNWSGSVEMRGRVERRVKAYSIPVGEMIEKNMGGTLRGLIDSSVGRVRM
jgi:hypothetical protein